MAATFTEIAKKANVSLALVSRFYNADPKLRISEEKQNRIKEAADALGGVRVNRAARSLASNLAYNIAMPIHEACNVDWFLTNMAGTEKFRALQETLRARDFRFSLNMISPDGIIDYVEDMIASQGYCDGVYLEYGMYGKDLANLLLKEGFPHVSVDPRAEKLGLNTVCEYGVSGLWQAVEHLVELGHRHIGYIGNRYRQALFLSAMLEMDIPYREEDVIETPKIPVTSNLADLGQLAANVFAEKFVPGQGPTAYVCGNDDMAMGIAEVLRAKGLEPGRDISLVGYDNIEGRRTAANNNGNQPFLTTVDIPFDQIGRRCAEVLLDQVVNKRKEIVHEHIPVKLIARSSTGPCKQ